MKMPIAVDEGSVDKISSGYLSLKPDDAEQIEGLEPGIKVTIRITGMLRRISLSQPSGEDGTYDGTIDFDAESVKIEKATNQFQALADDTDE